jgi:hypothetical protein
VKVMRWPACGVQRPYVIKDPMAVELSVSLCCRCVIVLQRSAIDTENNKESRCLQNRCRYVAERPTKRRRGRVGHEWPAALVLTRRPGCRIASTTEGFAIADRLLDAELQVSYRPAAPGFQVLCSRCYYRAAIIEIDDLGDVGQGRERPACSSIEAGPPCSRMGVGFARMREPSGTTRPDAPDVHRGQRCKTRARRVVRSIGASGEIAVIATQVSVSYGPAMYDRGPAPRSPGAAG